MGREKLEPTFDKHIIGDPAARHRARFGGDQHQFILDQRLDNEARPRARPKDQNQIEQAILQLAGERFGVIDIDIQGDVGDRFGHRLEPVNGDPIGQIGVQTEAKNTAHALRQGDALPALFPGPHHGVGVAAQTAAGAGYLDPVLVAQE